MKLAPFAFCAIVLVFASASNAVRARSESTDSFSISIREFEVTTLANAAWHFSRIFGLLARLNKLDLSYGEGGKIGRGVLDGRFTVNGARETVFATEDTIRRDNSDLALAFISVVSPSAFVAIQDECISESFWFSMFNSLLPEPEAAYSEEYYACIFDQANAPGVFNQLLGVKNADDMMFVSAEEAQEFSSVVSRVAEAVRFVLIESLSLPNMDTPHSVAVKLRKYLRELAMSKQLYRATGGMDDEDNTQE